MFKVTKPVKKMVFQPKREVPANVVFPEIDSDITIHDLFPPNFLSTEFLEKNGELLLTVDDISMEYIDESDYGDKGGGWKMCVSCRRITPMLVLNKTRAGQLAEICQSEKVIDWKNAGLVRLRTGTDPKYKKYQILIESEPVEGFKFVKSVNEINEELF